MDEEFLANTSAHFGQSHCYQQRYQLERQKLHKESRANYARLSSRLMPKAKARKLHLHDRIKQNPRVFTRGFLPITPEPAPSPRLWASAWARPLADDLNLTCHFSYDLYFLTFLLCPPHDISTLP